MPLHRIPAFCSVCLRVVSRWGPVVLMLLLMFAASADAQSVPRTSRFLEPICRWLKPDITAGQLDFVRLLVRKGAHMAEFAFLALFLLRALAWRGLQKRWFGGALLLAVLVAASDEFHQSFVPNRSASVADVGIDTAGALLGLAAAYGVWQWQERRRRARGAAGAGKGG